MKAVKLFLMLVLFLSLVGTSVYADEISNVTSEEENDVIRINLGDIERRPANLEANYEHDFNDLVDQFKNSDEEYNKVLRDLSKVSEDQKRKLELRKNFLDDYFENQAEKLLKIRYDEDRNIRQSIVERVQSSLKETDQTLTPNDYDFPYPTTDYFAEIGEYTQFDTGNYGEESGTGYTNFSHNSDDNTSQVRTSTVGCSFCSQKAEVHNGVVFGVKVANIGGPTSGVAEIRFWNQSTSAYLASSGGNANYRVDNTIYDANSNQMIYTSNYVEGSVSGTDVEPVSKGPHFIYFYNLTLNAADTIAAFTTTYAYSAGAAAASADETLPDVENKGTRWEKIDVYFE